MEEEITKIKELTPQHKKVNLLAKVVSIGEEKEIPSKYGGSRRLAEAVVGDDSGTIIMSLWQDQIDTVSNDDILSITNGYVSLVRGHMRLNVGKYGTISKSEESVEEINDELNMSDKEYEQEQRYRYSRESRSGGSYGRSRDRRY